MFNRKTEKQKLFSLAWANARHAAKFHGGKPCEYFAESLKLAYRGISLEAVRPYSETVTPDLISAVISTVIALAIILFSVWVAHPVAIISAVVGIAIGAAGYSDFELHFQAIKENKRINANTNFNRLITKF